MPKRDSRGRLVVEIDRARWARGQYRIWDAERKELVPKDTCLLTSRDDRCCLGFVMLEEGFADHELRYVGQPDEVLDETLEHRGGSVLVEDEDHGDTLTRWAHEAISINDRRWERRPLHGIGGVVFSEEKREAELLELCERYNSPVIFKFVGEGSPKDRR